MTRCNRRIGPEVVWRVFRRYLLMPAVRVVVLAGYDVVADLNYAVAGFARGCACGATVGRRSCLIAKSGPPAAASSRQDAFAWTTSSSERQNNRSDKASTHTR